MTKLEAELLAVLRDVVVVSSLPQDLGTRIQELITRAHSPPKRVPVVFVRPTLEDVQAYCR